MLTAFVVDSFMATLEAVEEEQEQGDARSTNQAPGQPPPRPPSDQLQLDPSMRKVVPSIKAGADDVAATADALDESAVVTAGGVVGGRRCWKCIH